MATPFKTVAFHTLGCKVNYSETSTMARNFTRNGYAVVNFKDLADVYIINSCSVTDNADRKARKAIRQILKRSPLAKIAIVGCYAQLKPEQIAKIPGVNIVVGTGEKFNLPLHIESNYFNSETVVLKTKIESTDTFIPSYSLGDRTRSFLKVQDGCNYNCSFCTIPLARGKSRSATVNETIALTEKIASKNIHEVVLTGINVGDFGIQNEETLFDLMHGLDKVVGIHRYRISSIEPNLLTDEIVHFMAKSGKFLPHFHIPLQSGSDTILKAMRRRYRADLFAGRINAIKSILPEAAIGVDIIVGFPGESNDYFQETYNFLETMDVSYIHVFSYSERDHTDALKIGPKVKADTIMERSKLLQKLSNDKKNKFHQQNNGIVREVLIENYDEGFLSGLTENYIRVKLPGQFEEVNTIISLQMSYTNEEEMIGLRIG